MDLPGMACVFYGDEKGLEGTLENEYRRPMAFDRSDALEDVYRRMIALRKEHPALRHGDFQTVLAQGALFLCRRSGHLLLERQRFGFRLKARLRRVNPFYLFKFERGQDVQCIDAVVFDGVAVAHDVRAF